MSSAIPPAEKDCTKRQGLLRRKGLGLVADETRTPSMLAQLRGFLAHVDSFMGDEVCFCEGLHGKWTLPLWSIPRAYDVALAAKNLFKQNHYNMNNVFS